MTTASAGQTTDPRAPLPLSRLTVLDLTLARAGPTCVRHLADWGANIIRIEPPVASGEDVAGKLFLFDGLALEWRTIRLPKDRGCKGCG